MVATYVKVLEIDPTRKSVAAASTGRGGDCDAMP
jgi:hypothetical protein